MPGEEHAMKPVKTQNVYLDQSVYGQMLDAAADWQGGEIASLLHDAQRVGTAQVWAGPTHVMETVQTQDVETFQRQDPGAFGAFIGGEPRSLQRASGGRHGAQALRSSHTADRD
jgi:hypothetical protein